MFYSERLGQVLSYKKTLSIIMSERGFGKTYAITKWTIKNALKHIEENEKQLTFIWIKRTQEEWTGKDRGGQGLKETFFDDMITNNEFPNWKLFTKGNLMLATNKDTGKTYKIGKFMSLNAYLKAKSNPHPNVEIAVFDEFMTEESYLPNETTKFFSLLDSVFRLRKARIILASNHVSQVNPYFIELGIKHNPNKEFITGEDWVLHNAQSNEYHTYHKQSTIGRLIKNSTYGDYAVNSKFLLDNTTNVGKCPSGTKTFARNIMLNGVKIAVYVVNGCYYFANATDMNNPFYTIYQEDAENGAIYLNKDSRDIFVIYSKFHIRGECYFENVLIRNEIVTLSSKLIQKI